MQIVRRRIGWAIRDRVPHRKVVREVQGVRMTLPWSHRLPDYARTSPEYGQNLVEIARLLATPGRATTVLDVGANVGDSALQILAATDARVLCIEADSYYLDFLETNVGDDPRAVIEASLLTAGPEGVMSPVRAGGTTRFEPGVSAATAPPLSIAELRTRHPEFDRLRLVKSDTDGYDVVLVPAIAATWADSTPVLFFEYDHGLSRVAGNDPLQVWPELSALGYETVAVWDNGGRPIGRRQVSSMAEVASILDRPAPGRAQHFWDVAVVHRDDPLGLAAVTALVPERWEPTLP
jgi:FkbM family methyltransferase